MIDGQEHRKNLKEFRRLFVEDINRLRQERGLSLDEISKQSNIPLSVICKVGFEHNMNWGTIYQLARFFDRKFRIMFY